MEHVMIARQTTETMRQPLSVLWGRHAIHFMQGIDGLKICALGRETVRLRWKVKMRTPAITRYIWDGMMHRALKKCEETPQGSTEKNRRRHRRPLMLKWKAPIDRLGCDEGMIASF